MSGIAQIFSGIQGLTSSNIPTPTNPFQPFPITTASGAFGDLSNIGLDPTEQALVDFLGGQQDVRTEDIYSRLGLGGSTMEAQDLGANELQRLAESASLISTNRGQAIQEQGTLGNLVQQEASLGTNAALTTQNQQIAAAQAQNTANQGALNNLVKGLSSLGSVGGSGTAAAAAPALV